MLAPPLPFYHSLIRGRIELRRVVENKIEKRCTVLDASGVMQDPVKEGEIVNGHLVVNCI